MGVITPACDADGSIQISQTRAQTVTPGCYAALPDLTGLRQVITPGGDWVDTLAHIQFFTLGAN